MRTDKTSDLRRCDGRYAIIFDELASSVNRVSTKHRFPSFEKTLGGWVRRTFFLLLAFSFLIFHSCKKPEILLNAPNEDISSLGGFIGSNFDYTLFNAALQYSGLLDTLNTNGPFTVLAPDNNAFNEIGIYRASDFQQMDKDSLREVLSHHILPYQLIAENIPEGIDISMATLDQGEILVSKTSSTRSFEVYNTGTGRIENITVNHKLLYFSGSIVTAEDIVFSNGVLYDLKKVIKSNKGKNVQEWLESHPDYSILVAGLKQFGLWAELGLAGPFTVFAPTNDVFLANGLTADVISQLDIDTYKGERLFGAYIMYGKRYFILDNDYYILSSGQTWYTAPLRGDASFNHLFSNYLAGDNPYSSDIYGNAVADGKNFYLGISKLKIPYGYAERNSVRLDSLTYYWGFDEDHFLGSGTGGAVENGGYYRGKTDYILSNGLVHDIQAILVLPEEALREED